MLVTLSMGTHLRGAIRGHFVRLWANVLDCYISGVRNLLERYASWVNRLPTFFYAD
jgi:hypothetical protein